MDAVTKTRSHGVSPLPARPSLAFIRLTRSLSRSSIPGWSPFIWGREICPRNSHFSPSRLSPRRPIPAPVRPGSATARCSGKVAERNGRHGPRPGTWQRRQDRTRCRRVGQRRAAPPSRSPRCAFACLLTRLPGGVGPLRRSPRTARRTSPGLRSSQRRRAAHRGPYLPSRPSSCLHSPVLAVVSALWRCGWHHTRLQPLRCPAANLTPVAPPCRSASSILRPATHLRPRTPRAAAGAAPAPTPSGLQARSAAGPGPAWRPLSVNARPAPRGAASRPLSWAAPGRRRRHGRSGTARAVCGATSAPPSPAWAPRGQRTTTG